MMFDRYRLDKDCTAKTSENYMISFFKKQTNNKINYGLFLLKIDNLDQIGSLCMEVVYGTRRSMISYHGII